MNLINENFNIIKEMIDEKLTVMTPAFSTSKINKLSGFRSHIQSRVSGWDVKKDAYLNNDIKVYLHIKTLDRTIFKTLVFNLVKDSDGKYKLQQDCFTTKLLLFLIRDSKKIDRLLMFQ